MKYEPAKSWGYTAYWLKKTAKVENGWTVKKERNGCQWFLQNKHYAFIDKK